MLHYQVPEVDGSKNADQIRSLNLEASVFPPLEDRHFKDGFWWFVCHQSKVVGFAGIVPWTPFRDVGYFKRAYIQDGHRGHGLQFRLMEKRLEKAYDLGWRQVTSDCHKDNVHSANNFIKAGFKRCDPEQKWAGQDDIYWEKTIREHVYENIPRGAYDRYCGR